MILLEKRRVLKKSESHKKMVEITRPAHIYGLWGGVITLVVSAFLLVSLINAGRFSYDFSFFGAAIFVHSLIGILMLVSVYLLRKEHHTFGGSVMLLCSSIIGLTLSSGLLIGPILGIIGGILGMSEHEKLIRYHLD